MKCRFIKNLNFSPFTICAILLFNISTHAELLLKQEYFLQSAIEQNIEIDSSFFSLYKNQNKIYGANFQTLPSQDGSYSNNSNTVTFNSSGIVPVNLLVFKGADSLQSTLNVDVLDFNRQGFPNSTFDSAATYFSINNWEFEKYGEAFLRDDNGDVFLELNTGDKDTLYFNSQQTKFTKVIQNKSYVLSFKIKSEVANRNGFKAWLTYGQDWPYKEHSVSSTSLSTEYQSFSIPFTVGFKGSVGIDFRIFGKNQKVYLNDLVVTEDGVPLDISNTNFETQTIHDYPEFHNWTQTDITHAELVPGVINKAGQFLTESNLATLQSQNIKTFNLALDTTYNLRFYAKANQSGAKLQLNIIDGNGNLTGAQKTFDLTTEFGKELSLSFTSPKSGKAGIKFTMLNANTLYTLDEVVLTSDPTPSAAIPFKSISVSDDTSFQNTLSGDSNVTHGDHVLINSGIYKQSFLIDNIKASKATPIVIEPSVGAEVIIDGTDQLTGTWVKSSVVEGAWELPSNSSIQQLWMRDKSSNSYKDYKMMKLARWPNVKGNFSDDFNPLYNARNPEAGTNWDYDATWVRQDHDARQVTIDSSTWFTNDSRVLDKDYTGAVIALKQGYNIVPERILSIDQVNQTITSTSYNYDEIKNANGKELFYIAAHINCLDQESEWHWESSTKKIMFIPPNGVNPNDFQFTAKVRTSGIQVNNSSGITVKGLYFFGAAYGALNSTGLELKDNVFDFPSYVPWALSDQPDSIRLNSQFSKSLISPAEIKVINNEFHNFDGAALILDGHNTYAPYVENNLFHNSRMDHLVRITTSKGATFRRNTLYSSERGNGLKFLKSPYGHLLAELNYFYDIASHHSDASMIQLQSGSQAYDVCRYNWFHDSDNKGIRCDGEPGGELATHMYNVGWNLRQGIQAKGREHSIINNTFFDCGKRCDITVLGSEEFGGNYGTRTYNNAGERISGHRVRPITDHPLPGDNGNNWVGLVRNKDIKAVLRDPNNLDFRPKFNSALVDSGETNLAGIDLRYAGDKADIGAYDFQSNDYWIPGRKLQKASQPIPKNKTYNAMPDADIMWLGGLEAKTYKVYFGTQSNSLELVSTQTNNIYDPGLLIPTQLYYWRIDEIKEDGSTVEGDTWRFLAGGISEESLILKTSYEENFNFSADDAEADPWRSTLWSREPLKDSLESDMIKDMLRVQMKDALPASPVNYLQIQDLNMRLREVPLMELSYRSFKETDTTKVMIRVYSANGKASDWQSYSLPAYLEKDFKDTVINISEIFSNWDAKHSGVAWTYTEKFDIVFGQDPQTFNTRAVTYLDNFKLGFLIAEDNAESIVITKQDSMEAFENSNFLITPMNLEIGLITTISNDTFPILNYGELNGTPVIVANEGDDYSIIDGGFINGMTTTQDFWEVPLSIEIGLLKSEPYIFKVKVIDDEVVDNTTQPISPLNKIQTIRVLENQLIVEINLNDQNYYQGEILDMSGRRVKTLVPQIGSRRVSTDNFNDGTYIVIIRDMFGGIKEIRQFVIKPIGVL